MFDSVLVDLKLLDSDNAAKASADVTFDTAFGELTLSRLRVIDQEGKEVWVAFPDIRYQDRETNEYRSIKVILPSMRLRKAISNAVIDKYAEAIASAG